MRLATSIALAGALALLGLSTRADDSGEIPLTVAVGAVAPIPGPVRQVVCDDGALVEIVDTGQGPGFKGLKPGTTLCSLVDPVSYRRVYRVTVVASPAPPPPPPGGSPGG